MTPRHRVRAPRPSVVAAAILPVAVALFLVWVSQWSDSNEALVEAQTAFLAPPPSRDQSLETVRQPERVFESEALPSENVGAAVAPVREPTAAQAFRVIVMPPDIDNAGPFVDAFVGSVRYAMIRALRARAGFEIVEVSVEQFAEIVPIGRRSARNQQFVRNAIEVRFGSGLIAELSERSTGVSPDWLIGLDLRRENWSGRQVASIAKNGDSRPGTDPESLGAEFAAYIAESPQIALEPPETPVDEQATLIDSSLPDSARLLALMQLRTSTFGAETMAAAIELGLRSPSAETRQRVWSLLRHNAYDPALVEPLAAALTADVDPAVRREAALSLGGYLRDPQAASILEYAELNDSSAEVRMAAQLAAMSFDERAAFARERLFDRNLAPAERLAPLPMMTALAGPRVVRVANEDFPEERRAYVEILRSTADPLIKAGALQGLQRTTLFRSFGGQDGQFEADTIRALIDSVAVVDRRVRLPALSLLRNYVDLPEVRNVYESVLEQDDEAAAVLGIAETLRKRRP